MLRRWHKKGMSGAQGEQTSTLSHKQFHMKSDICHHLWLTETPHYDLQKQLGRGPVAQSVAMRAVNPWFVSSNPSSANILFEVRQKSLWQASFVFHQWDKSMWKSSQLLVKNVVWSTGVRKLGNTWLSELATVLWLNFFGKRRLSSNKFLLHQKQLAASTHKI